MLDAREFLRGLDLARRRVREAAKRAMAQAGADLLDAAINEEPTVPFEHGTLRASGSVHLLSEDGEQLVTTSEGMVSLRPGAETPSPATESGEAPEPGSLSVIVGFNTPYAARLHEHPEFEFSEPGSGGKYLETKLISEKHVLMGRVAARIKAALDQGR